MKTSHLLTESEADDEKFIIDFIAVVILQFIMLICVAIYSVYHMANYQHSRETKFGKSLAARLLVISGEIFYLLSICYAPIDI